MHVGLPKTGTTHVQHVLWHNRAALREQDVLYPGDRLRRHFLAALDVQDSGFAGHEMPGTTGSWGRLTEEAASWRGTVLISHEMLAGAEERVVARIVASFPDRPVHVVITMRDLSRVIPATWQERAKNNQVESWQAFVDGLSTGSEANDRHSFWRLQDPVQVLERWSRHLPGEQIHVVTLPPPGEDQDLLLQRFCSTLGVDPSCLVTPESRANESMGAVEVALLQRVNRQCNHASLDFRTYARVIKRQLVPHHLAGGAHQVPFGLPESALGWIDPEVQRMRAVVSQAGCVVEGDLADLEPTSLGGSPARVDPDNVAETDLVERAVGVVVAQAVELDKARERNDRLERKLNREKDRHRQQQPSPQPKSLREAIRAWAHHKSRSSRAMAALLAARHSILRLYPRGGSRPGGEL